MKEEIEHYQSFREIHGQYVELRKTADYIWSRKEEIAAFFRDDRDVVFLASGSSYWMSLSAHKSFSLKTGKKCFAVKAGDVVLCPEEFQNSYHNPVLICPSRSGLTGEVLEAIRLLKETYPGIKVLSIVEYSNAALSEISDLALHIDWANEISVCQTRSFSCLYLVCLLMAEAVAGSEALIKELAVYLEKAPTLYARHSEQLQAIAEGGFQSLICLGSGRQYGICIEGAYIVIEMAEYLASYFQLLEYRHGPIVTANSGTCIFITSGAGNEGHEKKITEEAQKAGAKVYVIANQEAGFGDGTFALEGAFSRELVALHGVFCLQALAFHLSVLLGKNPDSPGELVPYITL